MTIPQVPIQLLVEAKEHRADLHISGDITKGFQFWGMTFKGENDVDYNDVAEALADLPDDITEIGVHIYSYGGEVAEGVAIYNALRSHSAKVTTVCEGFACSIASVVFMAGDERVMRDSSLLMLHNASMCAAGDANDHRKAADDLDVITELSKTAYLNHAKGDLTREKLTEIMDAETWVTPEEALEWGLATEIDKPSDEDGPTQSARTLVSSLLRNSMPDNGPLRDDEKWTNDFVGRFASRLSELPSSYIVTSEQIEAFAARVAQIVQKDEDEDEDDEDKDKDEKPDTDDDDGDDTDTDTDKDDDDRKQSISSARISQIFSKLAIGKNE